MDQQDIQHVLKILEVMDINITELRRKQREIRKSIQELGVTNYGKQQEADTA